MKKSHQLASTYRLFVFHCSTFHNWDIVYSKQEKVRTGMNVTLYVTLSIDIPAEQLTDTEFILKKQALEGMILISIFWNIRHFSKLTEFTAHCQITNDWTCNFQHKLDILKNSSANCFDLLRAFSTFVTISSPRLVFICLLVINAEFRSYGGEISKFPLP